MKLLVTGGAGFIGSNFVHYMLNAHPTYRVVNLDVLTYAGNLENLQNVEDDPRHRFVKGDICDRSLVFDLVSDGFDVIVNFAAESHVDRSILDASPFVRTNVLGTQVLLDAVREFGVSKYIQVSTDEVYGSLNGDGYFTEDTPLSPNSPYSASKASADLLVRATHHTYGIDVNITRCSNNYGPFQFPEKLIPLTISNALENRSIPVYGDGQQVRDWLHVLDHCRAIDRVIHHGRPGEVYNIGGHNERTNLEVVKRILSLLNKPESLIQHVQDRPGHDRRYAIDATKIRRELGWAPQYGFEEGLRQTIQWYLDHQEWLQRVKSKDYMRYYERQYSRRMGFVG
ncbi:dTDP-glucose 4,6-dehydratase [Kyrpidia tusciae]|uniref:dTDP-glucose 4,6-dehydratase n=1 Tax=Kyrpidia tusciae (strain DSM 2912 / NBRC 15312 / T2) TaxID=562970 RepID=D5WVY0_KYRT2|nr:dTDP-glucose 4,6-dehydratase [Kyrpidia tusciae]ADG05612.1 dTDP-glucose 4,6-dehydratase [Kyrpidia tusciae DSM 2912]